MIPIEHLRGRLDLDVFQTLEVLSASQTFVSTLRGCVCLRIFSLWIFVVAAVWALSPAGGQGVLRAVKLQEHRHSSEIRIQSYPINNVSYSEGTFDGANVLSSLYNTWTAVSGAAILGPDVQLIHSNGSSIGFQEAVARAGGDAVAIASTQSDLWRNVRIPFLHLLPGYHEERPFEWVDVPSDTIPPYESLVGIPIRGMRSTASGNTSMTISSNYQQLSVSATSMHAGVVSCRLTKDPSVNHGSTKINGSTIIHSA